MPGLSPQVGHLDDTEFTYGRIGYRVEDLFCQQFGDSIYQSVLNIDGPFAKQVGSDGGTRAVPGFPFRHFGSQPEHPSL